MGPGMMFGMGAFMLFWIALATVVCLLLIGLFIWLVLNWQKKQRTPPLQDLPQPHDLYQAYEEGYQTQHSPQVTYQEGGQQHPYPQLQYEQPPVQYSQTRSSEH
jgi:hypothetical protein